MSGVTDLAALAATTLEAAQANTLASVKVQVANLNARTKELYLDHWNNIAASVLAGRPAPEAWPKPPIGWVVGYFDDPTTGPSNPQSPYGDKVVQWAYPKADGGPVCDMPPIPQEQKPPAPQPARTDIVNVPIGDTFPVGHQVTNPANGKTYQKQSSNTPFGIAYWYQEVTV